MIFTRRFGALAARRTLDHISERAQDQILDLPFSQIEAETEQSVFPSAA